MPYSATMYLQTESLMPGAFLKEWCALKQILHKRKTKLAPRNCHINGKTQGNLIAEQTFSWWSVCRLQIPNFANIRANGKCKDWTTQSYSEKLSLFYICIELSFIKH